MGGGRGEWGMMDPINGQRKVCTVHYDVHSALDSVQEDLYLHPEFSEGRFY